MASKHSSPIGSVDVSTLKTLLVDGAEIALLDVREEGVKARDGHILLSAALPLSQMELRAWTQLPRRTVRIVVTDSGSGDLAMRAARKLSELGYSDISVLSGGVEAWKIAGCEIYTGQGVYSKAFGEFVEHAYGTPRIGAADLKKRIDNGEDIVVLDGRTLDEFNEFSIPGAHAVPNAELPYRVHGLVESANTLVVVNCAGRTRSIIGAQALINSGLPNRVAALENGTMGWLLEGFALQAGRFNTAPVPTAAALAKARSSVDRLTQKFGLDWIDAAGLDQLQAVAEERSLYVIDVRTKAEFEAGHVAGARWVEGGQLIQAIDKFIPVRNARIVIVDNQEGVRAAITASWLRQLNWGEVFALAAAPERMGETGALIPPTPRLPTVASITPRELQARLKDDALVVLDLTASPAYEKAHISGSHFAIRSQLGENREALAGKDIVLVSPDGTLAYYAAPELALHIGEDRVRVLEGGLTAWLQTGLPVEGDAPLYHHSPDDVWRSPYQAAGDRHTVFKQYLAWEVDLLAKISSDPMTAFKTW